jgi:hypothetical protein
MDMFIKELKEICPKSNRLAKLKEFLSSLALKNEIKFNFYEN